jgi:hypothetical protein
MLVLSSTMEVESSILLHQPCEYLGCLLLHQATRQEGRGKDGQKAEDGMRSDGTACYLGNDVKS